jgi:tripartite-type tricarboxylate transporter receptor subunit TctC
MTARLRLLKSLIALSCGLLLFAACAEMHPYATPTPASNASRSFPVKPVRLIEPFGAGGGVDTISRPIAQKLSELWGQPMTVENHTGAGSTAAPALVARSSPDGYTLLVSSSAQAYAAVLRHDLPYDPVKDFIPVAPLTRQGYVLVAGKAASVIDPGRAHCCRQAATRCTQVRLPRRRERIASRNPATQPRGRNQCGARAGQCHCGSHREHRIRQSRLPPAPIPLAVRDIRAGRLVPLGVSSARRSPLLPDVPTIAEAGVPGFDYSIWYGIWAPAGTPATVIDKVARDIAQVLAAPDLRQWLAEHGAEPISMTPRAFAEFVASERESAARVVEASGATSEPH